MNIDLHRFFKADSAKKRKITLYIVLLVLVFAALEISILAYRPTKNSTRLMRITSRWTTKTPSGTLSPNPRVVPPWGLLFPWVSPAAQENKLRPRINFRTHSAAPTRRCTRRKIKAKTAGAPLESKTNPSLSKTMPDGRIQP